MIYPSLRLYPSLRKYLRHSWHENGVTARPTFVAALLLTFICVRGSPALFVTSISWQSHLVMEHSQQHWERSVSALAQWESAESQVLLSGTFGCPQRL